MPALGFGLLCLLVPQAAGAGEVPSLARRANDALARSSAWLIEQQADDGSWQRDDASHPLGRTALCGYALVHAGYRIEDAPVRKALEFLHSRDFAVRSTYETGCLLLFLDSLGPQHSDTIRALTARLLDWFDAGSGLWGYPAAPADLSNTQFAVLGLHIGQRHGARVPRATWSEVIEGVLRLQHEDGSFRYRNLPDVLSTGSMTHAALIALHLAADARGGRPTATLRRATDAAMQWCTDRFTVAHNPHGKGHHSGYFYYYMWGMMRYAQLYGLPRIGDRDWYREGAEALLERQQANGSWGALAETAFAVLFLRRAVFSAPRDRTRPAAADAVAAPQAKRSVPDPTAPFLRRWLVAGPYLSKPGEDDMLETPHFSLRGLRPRDGQRAGGKRWRVHDTDSDDVDLLLTTGGGTWCAFYAAVYLHADAATDAAIWVGSDDGFAAYLDGRPCGGSHHHDYSGDDHTRVPLSLRAGANLLLLKVENTGYFAHFKARLTAADGSPVEGVRDSLSARR